MNEPSDQDDIRMLRRKIIGLGERSISKSYYPELRRRLDQLEVQKTDLEEKTRVLLKLMEALEEERRKTAASEADYRSVIENIQDVFFRSDARANLSMASPSLLTLLGYESFDECLGKPIAETFFYYPEKRAEFNRQIQEKRSVTNYEVVLKRKDGMPVTVETSSHIYYDSSGAVAGVEGIFRDITERKQAEAEKVKLEERYRQAQKIEAIGQLAGGIAHDFNNMLNIILGYSQMALMKIELSSPLYASLQEIMNTALRSADLVRQLLAFARKQTIAPKALDLNDTVAGMLNMLQKLIGEDMELLWMPAENLRPVKMDPVQIDQILANLAVNARDSISGVGKITIETGNEDFDEAYCVRHPGFVPGHYTMLAVSDNGCGMDKETMDKIFEPFFTTKEIGKGTGMGLATIYGIVKQNNGFINVYSEPEKGTTFKIYLPRHDEEKAEIVEPRRRTCSLTGTETVLLVEDNEALLKMTKSMLEELGYTALTASCPIEAIKLAEQYAGGIHLVLTDVVMPEMSGRDLQRRLIVHWPNLKFLFMSGYTTNVIAHRGILDEGVCFLQKPFHMEALATKIRVAIER